MRIPDQLLHCRYDVNLTLQVADANFVVCELSSKVTVGLIGAICACAIGLDVPYALCHTEVKGQVNLRML